MDIPALLLFISFYMFVLKTTLPYQSEKKQKEKEARTILRCDSRISGKRGNIFFPKTYCSSFGFSLWPRLRFALDGRANFHEAIGEHLAESGQCRLKDVEELILGTFFFEKEKRIRGSEGSFLGSKLIDINRYVCFQCVLLPFLWKDTVD